MRGRVKQARAVVANMPGLAETLAGDWRKAAAFYARFGVTETMFRLGVPPALRLEAETLVIIVREPRVEVEEVGVRAEPALS